MAITKELVERVVATAIAHDKARAEMFGEEYKGSAVSMRSRQQVKEVADVCGTQIVRKQYESIAAYDTYVDGVLFFFTEVFAPKEDF